MFPNDANSYRDVKLINTGIEDPTSDATVEANVHMDAHLKSSGFYIMYMRVDKSEHTNLIAHLTANAPRIMDEFETADGHLRMPVICGKKTSVLPTKYEFYGRSPLPTLVRADGPDELASKMANLSLNSCTSYIRFSITPNHPTDSTTQARTTLRAQLMSVMIFDMRN